MPAQQTYPEDVAPNNIEEVNEKHFALTLLLDTSGSMRGKPIDSLNNELNNLIQQLQSDSHANVIDISIVTFGSSVNVIMPFTSVSSIDQRFELSPSGITSMGQGLLKAAEITNERRRQYYNVGVPAFKPWIFMITDGEPTDTDNMQLAKQELITLQKAGKLKLFVLGVEGYNREKIRELVYHDGCILELKGFDFREIMNWFAKSVAIVSHSSPGEKPTSDPLPPTVSLV